MEPDVSTNYNSTGPHQITRKYFGRMMFHGSNMGVLEA